MVFQNAKLVGATLAALAVTCAPQSAEAAEPSSAEPESAVPAAGEPAATEPDAKLVCIAAFEQAQREHNQSHYLASRAALTQCAEVQCGEALARECSRMYAQIEEATPSVVVAAYDAAQDGERSDVSVLVDGQPFIERLDGTALPIDPGRHTFTFSAPGVEPVTMEVVIRAGEKYRVVKVSFPNAAKPEPAHSAVLQPPALGLGAPGTAQAQHLESDADLSPLVYVFGGIGVLGLGTFATLRVVASNDFDSMKEACAPACSESDVSKLKLKYTLSSAALGVGAASLGAAVVIYAVGAGDQEKPDVAISVVPNPGGTSLLLDTRF